MKTPPPINEQNAIQIASDFLKDISFADRVVIQHAAAAFFDGDVMYAEMIRDFPEIKIPRLSDTWHVTFPLKEPLPEVDVDRRYVIVDAVTGAAKMGLA